MPIYCFEHPKTGEQKEILLGINDKHEFVDDKDVRWNRVYSFNLCVKGGQLDPWNNKDYLRKTGEMKGTIGDMWDLSKEMSERRAKDNGGIDPIKEKKLAEDKKVRKGFAPKIK